MMGGVNRPPRWFRSGRSFYPTTLAVQQGWWGSTGFVVPLGPLTLKKRSQQGSPQAALLELPQLNPALVPVAGKDPPTGWAGQQAG